MNFKPYNPLDKKNLGASVAEALLEQSIHKLGSLQPFTGAGIYAIYYTGPHPLYEPVSRLNAGGTYGWPIYVGKAIPAGARKGKMGLDTPAGKALHGRLREHAESIRATEDLDIDDFQCRFLIVDDIWIPLGESLLIAKLSPVWNSALDGFGNHDPGRGRYNGKRPQWDVLHPGRPWAEKCQKREETTEQLTEEVSRWLNSVPISLHPKLHDA